MKNQKKPNNKLYPDTYTTWSSSPSPENTSALLHDLSNTISGALKSYGGGDVRNTTRARILAMKAIKSYDPKKGVQLNTHIMSQLQALNRTARQRQNMIHLPENIYFNQRAINEARKEYMHKYNREPTDTALADSVGLSVKQIQKASQHKQATPSSFAVSEKGDDMVHKDRDYYDIWVDYVYNDMDDKDRKIFEGVSGYNGKKIKPKQILAKELKMTPAAISYRVNNIVSKLEEMPKDAVG